MFFLRRAPSPKNVYSAPPLSHCSWWQGLASAESSSCLLLSLALLTSTTFTNSASPTLRRRWWLPLPAPSCSFRILPSSEPTQISSFCGPDLFLPSFWSTRSATPWACPAFGAPSNRTGLTKPTLLVRDAQSCGLGFITCCSLVAQLLGGRIFIL